MCIDSNRRGRGRGPADLDELHVGVHHRKAVFLDEVSHQMNATVVGSYLSVDPPSLPTN